MNKEIKVNYLNAKKTYDEHMMHIRALQKKGAELDAGMPALRMAAEAAEAEKKKALDSFCIGKIVESEVEQTQMDFDTASARLKHSRELLETVNKKIGVAEQSTVSLLEKVRKYQAEVWQQIVPEIEERFVKRLSNEFIYLFAANNRQRGSWAYEPLLTKLFPKPTREQLDSFNGTLDEKFRKAIH